MIKNKKHNHTSNYLGSSCIGNNNAGEKFVRATFASNNFGAKFVLGSNNLIASHNNVSIGVISKVPISAVRTNFGSNLVQMIQYAHWSVVVYFLYSQIILLIWSTRTNIWWTSNLTMFSNFVPMRLSDSQLSWNLFTKLIWFFPLHQQHSIRH